MPAFGAGGCPHRAALDTAATADRARDGWAIAAIVACLSGPCEVAALIAALGYAGAMIVLGIIRSRGDDTSSEAFTTEAAEDEGPGEEALASLKPELEYALGHDRASERRSKPWRG